LVGGGADCDNRVGEEGNPKEFIMKNKLEAIGYRRLDKRK